MVVIPEKNFNIHVLGTTIKESVWHITHTHTDQLAKPTPNTKSANWNMKMIFRFVVNFFSPFFIQSTWIIIIIHIKTNKSFCLKIFLSNHFHSINIIIFNITVVVVVILSDKHHSTIYGAKSLPRQVDCILSPLRMWQTFHDDDYSFIVICMPIYSYNGIEKIITINNYH